MIFVSVGTQKFSFERLLKEIDHLINKNYIKEDVFAQIGYTDYVPENYLYKEFISEEIFDQKLRECRILITHGGVGTITKALQLEKKILIVPRMKKYHEHVDDHQIEIASAFQNRNFALSCMNINELESYIIKIQEQHFSKYLFSYAGVTKYVREFILESEEKEKYDSDGKI